MKRLLFALLSTLVISLFLLGQGLSSEENMDKADKMDKGSATAVFAGGCFWCTESDFEKVPGVSEAISGYTGGSEVDPTYEQVAGNKTGHVEAVKVVYDPARVSYAQLVEWFWRHVNPTDSGGQFVDRGAQYRSVIFVADDQQRRVAETSKQRLAVSGHYDVPIVTEILPLGPFYDAEEYHQDYYKKNSFRYGWYRSGSGRDQFLESSWGEEKLVFSSIEVDFPELKPMLAGEMKVQPDAMGMTSGKTKMKTDEMMERSGEQGKKSAGVGVEKDAMQTGQSMAQQRRYTIPTDAELRKKLTPLQYNVTRENGTERPFANSYWNNHRDGIYVDIVSGEPLFSSTDKYESGTGWPSFTRPLEPENIFEQDDIMLFTVRTEVRSMHADSHLGHVFEDGPAPTGLRYCINSAALRFVPKEELEKEGYGEYQVLFK